MAEDFEQFVVAQLSSLLRLAGVLAGDHGTAEDVVQDVLLRAAPRWAVISAVDAPEAYVRRMVVNEYLSWRRKWSRLVPRAEVTDSRDVPDPADRQAEHDDLSRRLARLPARQRAVLVLRYYEDLPDVAIAEVVGCSTGTVRSHASRALAALRIEVTDQADPEPSGVVTAHREEP